MNQKSWIGRPRNWFDMHLWAVETLNEENQVVVIEGDEAIYTVEGYDYKLNLVDDGNVMWNGVEYSHIGELRLDLEVESFKQDSGLEWE